MTSDRLRNLLCYAAALGGYALLGVALVLAVVLVIKRGRDEPPPGSEHLTWIGDSLEKAAAERRKDPPPGIELFVDRYLEDPRVLVCPSVDIEFREDYWPVKSALVQSRDIARDMSYCYVGGLSETHGHDYAIAFDEEWNHAESSGRPRVPTDRALGPEKGGVNVLYTGGHVEWKGDLDRFQIEVTAQLLDMQKGGAKTSIHRPWWSRYPRPPAFEVPPPAREDGSLLTRAPASSLVIGAAAALVGVYLLRRVAR